MTVLNRCCSNIQSFAYCSLVLLIISACSTQPPGIVLNSDLINEKFGNYSVDILYSSDKQRITSLNSSHNDEKTCRTFAVVDFAEPIPRDLLNAHYEITAGGSIGAVFRAAGWEIEKHNMFIGELSLDKEQTTIGRLMRLDLPQELAVHIYLFVLKKDGLQQTYATILEAHHPDHLSIEELNALYGEMLFDDSNRTNFEDFVELPENF